MPGQQPGSTTEGLAGMTVHRRDRSAPNARDERGGVLVLVAVFLPVALMLMSFVVDVGNWWEHKRHLQLQADAAVLSGGGMFSFPCTTSVDSAIYSEALRYAGPSATNPGAPYNPQVGGVPSANVHVVLNDGAAPGTAGAPCGTDWVDAQLTEDDAPWFIKVADLAGLANPTIHAHARAEILTPDVGQGLLPVGYEESDPQYAAAVLVDDATGARLDAGYLTKRGPAGNLVQWDNASTPFTRTVAAGDQLSAVIALSQTSFSIAGSAATICGQTGVVCYHDNGGTYTGLPYIRAYAPNGGAGSLSSPIVRSAYLSAGTCSPDPNFTTGACSPVLVANIDTGSAGTDLRRNPVPNVAIAAAGATLTCTAPCNANVNQWTGSVPSPTRGLRAFTLTGTYKPCTGSGNACHATDMAFGSQPVQRMLVGPEDPVELAEFVENGGTVDSMAAGQHTFSVQIGVLPSLQVATSVSSPLFTLDIQGTTSHTRALDCDPAISNFKTELASGCNVGYAPNGFAAPWFPCPKQNAFPAQPWQCVTLQTATVSPSQLSDGMSTRTGNTAGCANPSHWSSFPNIPDGDPRILTIFRVPFGSFAGSGNDTLPVTGFAAFYVTGWGGQGNNGDPCAGDDQTPVGTMVGHFIKYVSHVDNAPATQPCDPNDPTYCELVLTQ